MKRRVMLSGLMAIAIDPVPLAIGKKKKPDKAIAWASPDTDVIGIGLHYPDGTSSITKIPATWFFDHPIETEMLARGTPNAAKLDWVELCAEIVEMYVNGK